VSTAHSKGLPRQIQPLSQTAQTRQEINAFQACSPFYTSAKSSFINSNSACQHTPDGIGQFLGDKLGNITIGADFFDMVFVGGAGQ